MLNSRTSCRSTRAGSSPVAVGGGDVGEPVGEGPYAGPQRRHGRVPGAAGRDADEPGRRVGDVHQAQLAVAVHLRLPALGEQPAERRDRRVVVRPAVLAVQVGQQDVVERQARVGQEAGGGGLGVAVGGAVAGLHRVGEDHRAGRRRAVLEALRELGGELHVAGGDVGRLAPVDPGQVQHPVDAVELRRDPLRVGQVGPVTTTGSGRPRTRSSTRTCQPRKPPAPVTASLSTPAPGPAAASSARTSGSVLSSSTISGTPQPRRVGGVEVLPRPPAQLALGDVERVVEVAGVQRHPEEVAEVVGLGEFLAAGQRLVHASRRAVRRSRRASRARRRVRRPPRPGRRRCRRRPCG